MISSEIKLEYKTSIDRSEVLRLAKTCNPISNEIYLDS